MFNEGVKYRFETNAEAEAWRKEHYPNGGGLYQLDRIWLGEVREEHELYMEAGQLGISCQDLYDQKHGIARYDI
jgi:hypothetical protein